MKVLNLQCGLGHGFEGWFGNEADYQDQQTRGSVTCPLCGDGQVVKLPSAPRLNLHTATIPRTGAPATSAGEQSPPKDAPATAGNGDVSPGNGAAMPRELQTLWMRAMREVMARTEDVGPRFPEQALRMHHGEEAVRAIRGQATPEQARALLDEGVELLPLPMLPGLKETLQ